MSGIKFAVPAKNSKTEKLKNQANNMELVSEDYSSRKYAMSTTAMTGGLMTKVGYSANVQAQPMFFSPLHTPQNWNMPGKRREIYTWCRFYYDSEPKVAAGIEFYSTFPMNGFRIEHWDKKVLKFYENFVKKVDLAEVLLYIAHDYYLLGECFPFAEIDCPVCGGGDPSCSHPGGTFRRVMVLNPDSIDVQNNPFSSDPIISLLPDEDLKLIVQRREPKEVFDQLTPRMIEMISSGRPIRLSNTVTSHIKHNTSGYSVYGTSMIRRLFPVLAYKTKLMTANWITAERLILPMRLAKVGSDERPAGDNDLMDIQEKIASTINEPNLTLVTHHNVDIDFIGATGKIHDMSKELEYIGKEILDGLMLNQAILNGEAAGYTSAQVGVEILIKRLEQWRNKLSRWIEERIFLPLAQMQGFIDEEESALLGEPVYKVPRIKWNDLGLRDPSARIQLLFQAYDKKMVSAQTICSELGLDYDQEQERLREETTTIGPGGALMGGGPGGGMDLGGLGGLGGGMPPMDMGMPPGDLGMPPMDGGDMGGMPPMDMPMDIPMPGSEPIVANTGPSKIERKGKGHSWAEKQAEELKNKKPMETKTLRMTSLEGKMLKLLNVINAPLKLFAQYEVMLPGNTQPYKLDFAYPQLRLGIDVDGEFWHSRPENKRNDMKRDQRLASAGWTILRFNEDAMNGKTNLVKDVITTNIIEAAKRNKTNIKTASGENVEGKLYRSGQIHKVDELNLEHFDYIESDGDIRIMNGIYNV